MIDLFTHFAANHCDAGRTFFGLPTWYKYLPQSEDTLGNCTFSLEGLDNGYWLIALAIVEIVIRLAALVAIGYVLWGGIRYVMSQGEPDNTRAALQTVTRALVGLVIAVVSAAFISFLANNLAP